MTEPTLTLPVTLTGVLQIPLADCPPDVLHRLSRGLSFANPEYEQRKRLGHWLGDLDATNLRSETRQQLRLQHHRAADLGGKSLRLRCGLRRAALRDGDAVPGHDPFRLELVEAHVGPS